jgi:Zn-dependent alcohol dehydrogenase
MPDNQKIKAAVLYAANAPFKFEEIELEDPGPGEIKVKIEAVGLCHTDLHAAEGGMPIPLPIVLGHEGAGIVEKIGSGVNQVKPGDHVVLASGFCGRCSQCARGMPVLCEVFRPVLFKGTLLGGQRRLKKDGQWLNHFGAQSSFAEYAVVNQETAIKIRPDAPLDKVALFACGASTGISSVLNAAQVMPGASVAIFGCGGLGLSAVMAARLVGAGKIIAVDIAENKLESARDLGATHGINSTKEDPVKRIIELTGGGVDYSFEFVGNVSVITQALVAVRSGGKCISSGAVPGNLNINAMALLTKTIIFPMMGFMRQAVDIPRFIDLYMDGKLPLDKLISRTYPLSEINAASTALRKGELLRGMLIP